MYSILFRKGFDNVSGTFSHSWNSLYATSPTLEECEQRIQTLLTTTVSNVEFIVVLTEELSLYGL